MADNVAITPGTGATVAADDVGAGVLVQRVKAVLGADGSAVDPIAVSHGLDSSGAGVAAVGILGEFDDAATAAVTENQLAPVRITSAREFMVSDAASAAVHGTTAGAKVVTDTTGTIQQYLRGIVTFLANALGAGTAAAANRVTLASDDPAVATLGATSGAAVITDANGTIQQYLRGLIKQWIAGTLKLASVGYSASVSVTRPSDTTAYGAGDVVGVTGGGTATITFANMGPGAGEILITSATFERNASAIISGETSYILHLYNVTQPGAQIDNAVFDVAAGDRTAYLGSINLGIPVDLGSTLYVATDGINKQVTLTGTSLFGVLVTVGAYTPASAAVHVVTLHAVAV